MPHHNVLSQLRSAPDILNRLIPVKLIKLVSNSYFQLVISLSLAIVAQEIGLHKSTLAVNSDSSLGQQSHHQQDRTVEAERKSSIYLADNKVSAKPTQVVHQVRQGDTVTKIASEYQVSRQELVELNQITNSNVIFVNQKLQIPAIVSQKEIVQSNADSETEDPYIANLRVEIDRLRAENKQQKDRNSLNTSGSESKQDLQDSLTASEPNLGTQRNISSNEAEDPYIADLKAEIDQLRTENKLEQAAQDNSESANLVSVSEGTSETTAVSKPSSSIAKSQNSQSLSASVRADLVEPETVALTLPPLIDEEYLPQAFDGYAWPAQGVLTSGYGWRWGRLHGGIDIAAPIGTPIVAAASGKVVGAGWHGGYGNLVKLEHIDGSVTYYAHANRILVTHDQEVKQGELIAEMGTTGNSTGSHLHFEIHLRDRTIANPMAFLSSK